MHQLNKTNKRQQNQTKKNYISLELSYRFKTTR